MHSSQIITQSLNTITPKQNSMLAAESKPTSNFNTVLNKEVNNQNKNNVKANNNNESNKNKVNKQTETSAAPPKQEASKLDKNNNLEKKAIDESDSQSEPAESTIDEANTLLNFVDQLSQLGLQVQSNVTANDVSIDEAANALSDGKEANGLSATSLDSKLSIQAISTDNTPLDSANKDQASEFSNMVATMQTAEGTEKASPDVEQATKQFKSRSFGVNGAADKNVATNRNLTESNTDNANNLIQTQLQAATDGLSQIMANAEQAASEKSTLASNQSTSAVTTDADTVTTSKTSSTKDKFEGANQIRDLQNGVSQRDSVTAKFDQHKEKVTERANTSILAESVSEQNNPITGLQNQTPPSETTKLNEMVKTQAGLEHIAPRVGTKAWDQAISQKVVWMVAGGEQTAELSLNPPDLGPLQVVLSISDNQVDASFISSHLDVREAIEAAAPKLKEMMDSAGISLSGFSVNAEAKSSSSQSDNQQSDRDRSANFHQAESISTPIERATTTRTERGQLSAVDTFV